MPLCQTGKSPSYKPLFDSRDKIHKIWKRSSRSPDSETHHIRHISRFRSSRSGSINYTSLGQLILQLQRRETSLGWLARSHGAQVFRLVTLVKYDYAVEVFAAPLQQLFEPSLVLSGSALRFTDQRRIGAKYDTLLDVVICGGVYFGIF